MTQLILLELNSSHQGVETELECGDVVLFWRIQQMLKVQGVHV